jgi:hypothetical protein
LAKGAVVMDNGEMVVKNQQMINELGLNAATLRTFNGVSKETVKELTEFGQSLNAGNAKVEAMYSQMANTALANVDTSKMTKEAIQ